MCSTVFDEMCVCDNVLIMIKCVYIHGVLPEKLFLKNTSHQNKACDMLSSACCFCSLIRLLFF